jgi:peptidylprolyl isomerase domain and WD repeat-containing protein 1
MSEDPSVLGKRGRNEEDPNGNAPNVPDDAESDDDDLGPMPMPAGAEGSSKKKRKGMFTFES